MSEHNVSNGQLENENDGLTAKEAVDPINTEPFQAAESRRSAEHQVPTEQATVSGRNAGVGPDDVSESRSRRQLSVPNIHIPAADDVYMESLVRIANGSSDPEARKADIEDGWGTHTWTDGCEYTGEWLSGLPNGRGRFHWPTGDAFEGEWKSGLHNGVGTFICRNGSTYYGNWLGGRQHGEGVYKPANADNRHAEVIFLQAYQQGRLIQESVLRVDEMDVRKIEEKKKSKKMKSTEKKNKETQQKVDARVVLPRPGVPVDKQNQHYNLMRQLQLGIMFSIARAGRLGAPHQRNNGGVTEEEFKLNVEQYFPGGANTTSFKWKDYAPTVFQRLRHLFGIDATDYLLSLTGDRSLRIKQSDGKSGCMFFLSEDDQYLIKEVRKEEMQLLMELIPKYFAHVEKNPHTLLTRFYGVHRVRSLTGHSVRFIVMGNVFPTDIVLHRKYDLKGSSYKRTVGPVKLTDRNVVLKDLDLDVMMMLESNTHDALMAQLRSDLDLLRALKVMDYSLLLGVHVMEWGNDATRWQPPQRTPGDDLRRGFVLRASRKYNKSEQKQPLHERFVCCAPRFAHTKSVYRQNTFRTQDGSTKSEFQTKGGISSQATVSSSIAGSQASPVAPCSNGTSPAANIVADRQPDGQSDADVISPFYDAAESSAASDTDGEGGLENSSALPPVRQRHASMDPSFQSKVSELIQRMENSQRLHSQAGASSRQTSSSSEVNQVIAANGSVQRPPRQTGYVEPTDFQDTPRTTSSSQGTDGFPTAPSNPLARGPSITFPPWVRQVLDAQHEGATLAEAASLRLETTGKPASSPAARHARSRSASSPTKPLPIHQRPHSWDAAEPKAAGAPSAAEAQLGSTHSVADTPSSALPPHSPFRGSGHSMKVVTDQLLMPFRDAFSDMSETLEEDLRNMAKVPALCDRCGAAVPAMAISKTGAFKPRAVLLYFGIIDFLQDYNLRKRLEHVMKSTVHDGDIISVVHPTQYSRRFMDFMGAVFVKKA